MHLALLLSCFVLAASGPATGDAGSADASPLPPPPPPPTGPLSEATSPAPVAVVLPPALPPAASSRRVLVLGEASAPQVLRSALTADLRAEGAIEVPEARLRSTLRDQFRSGDAAREAEALRHRGLDAEQNLDLDTAIRSLTEAGSELERAGAAAIDPEALAEVRLELAQCEAEKGDGAAAQSELRRWAELGPPPLDARAYPPAFVAAASEAQSVVSAHPRELPLTAIWSTALVDDVVVLSAVGPSGSATTLLLHYPAGALQPKAASSFIGAGAPDEQRASAERAVREVWAGPTDGRPSPAVEARPVVPPGSELHFPLTLMVGFVFPAADAYSRNGASTVGVGVALAGRVATSLGEVGLRVDIVGGNFSIEQITPTMRWTWHKGRVTFDFEPGVFVQIRGGCTQNGQTCQEAADPSSSISVSESAALLGVEAAGGIGYQLSESWSLEEQASLGVIVAGNYDLNAPIAFQSRLAYRF